MLPSFNIDKIYLPPPFKYVTKGELNEMITNNEIVPCDGIHLSPTLQVDYFVIRVSRKNLIRLTMGGEIELGYLYITK